MEYLNVVFVGHVDHGKSTLIGRLLYETGSLPEEKLKEIREVSGELGHDVELAYVMDHLSEERQRMMTIDTAQSFFRTDKRRYVIIDAPGHKELLKNMITGASQADAAVLLIDANEGIMEQTRRHAYIIGMLGIGQSVVAVNKMDLIGYDEAAFNALKESALAFLKQFQISPVAVIPLSAKVGDNVARLSEKMTWYRGPTFCEQLDLLSTRVAEKGRFRMPVQDVYEWVEGGIVVGRVESGAVRQGDSVLIEPGSTSATVREIRKFMSDVRSAEAGECVGLLLDGEKKPEAGEVLCDPADRPSVADRMRANLFWLDKAPFIMEERLRLRLATRDVFCRIESVEQRVDSSTLEIIETDARTLKETEVGRVIIRTEQPVVLEQFSNLPELGRFVLERGMNVAAGGTVISSL